MPYYRSVSAEKSVRQLATASSQFPTTSLAPSSSLKTARNVQQCIFGFKDYQNSYIDVLSTIGNYLDVCNSYAPTYIR
jgi:hypothetical protein